MTVRSFESIRKAMPGTGILLLGNAPETARRVKDEGELQCIEKACDISCKAFDALLPRIKPGLTEKQLPESWPGLRPCWKWGADGLGL